MTPRQDDRDWWIPPRAWLPVTLAAGAVLTALYVATHLQDSSVTAMVTLAPAMWTKSWGGWTGFGSAAAVHGRALMAAMAMLALAAAAGRAPALWLRDQGRLVAIGMGLGVFALGVLALALLGLLGRGMMLGLGFLAAGAGAWGGRPRRAAAWDLPAPVITVAIGVLLATDLLACLSPEWFLDGRMYHLALPERWLQTGKFPVMAGHLLTFLPLNTEMLYAPALAFGGEEGAKLLNLAFGVLLLAAVARLAQRLGRPGDGGIAALVLLTMPLTLVENEIAFSDNLRAFFETLALIAAVDVLRRNGRGSLGVSAVFLGLAMGTKYLSVIRSGLVVLAVLALPGFGGVGARLRRSLRLVAVATCVVGPWLARNWLAGRDPVYPFGLRCFGSLGYTSAELARWMADNRHYGVAGQTFTGWLTLPIRLALEPVPGEFGTFPIGAFGVACGLLVLARRRWPAGGALVAGVVVLEGLIWSRTSELIRYLLPGAAALAALSGWGLGALRVSRPRWSTLWLSLLWGWAGCGLVLRVHHRFNLTDLYGGGGYAFGRFTRQDALDGRGFGRRLEALPPGPVLLVGEDQALGLDRPWVGCTVYNRMTVKVWAQESVDARRFAAKVRQSGVRSVILNLEGFRAWELRGPGFTLLPRELAMLNPWWRSLRRVAEAGPRLYYALPSSRRTAGTLGYHRSCRQPSPA